MVLSVGMFILMDIETMQCVVFENSGNSIAFVPPSTRFRHGTENSKHILIKGRKAENQKNTCTKDPRGRCSARRSVLSAAVNPDDVDRILGKLYDWSGYSKVGGDGYCTTQEEDEMIEAASGPLSYEYGEITSLGMRTLASFLDLGPDDAFFDLGSGVSPSPTSRLRLMPLLSATPVAGGKMRAAGAS